MYTDYSKAAVVVGFIGLVACLALVARPFPAPRAPLDSAWLVKAPPRMGTAFPIACVREGAGYRVMFMTAGHVVGEASVFSVSEGGMGLAGGRLERRHPEKDLALISFRSPVMVRPLKLDCRELRFGERVFVVSWPGGHGPYLTEGRAARPGFSSAPIFPGSSGAPVIDPSSGAVVGVVTAGMRAGLQMVTFAGRYESLVGLERWALATP